ncbi:hypothetical protein [Deinococcus sp. AJ005]|nr:hypothetical protein [Deinococcus sp. AJ005]
MGKSPGRGGGRGYRAVASAAPLKFYLPYYGGITGAENLRAP